jgi:hypothetical protein
MLSISDGASKEKGDNNRRKETVLGTTKQMTPEHGPAIHYKDASEFQHYPLYMCTNAYQADKRRLFCTTLPNLGNG